MAEKRMFSKDIIDSDNFLDMPISARLLYYDLGMRADDDGFVSAPKKIMRIIGATNDDMNILITRGFVICFDSGIIAIRHWRINNYLRKDRYKGSIFTEEKEQLALNTNNEYLTAIEADALGIPLGLPLVDADKNREEENKEDKEKEEKKKQDAEKKKQQEQEVNDFFDSLWKLYPRKEGKSSVKMTQRKELYKIGYATLEKALRIFCKKMENTDEKYIPYGSSFFNTIYKDYIGLDEKSPVTIPIQPPKEEEPQMTDEEWERMLMA